jgi:hypothetical protein
MSNQIGKWHKLPTGAFIGACVLFGMTLFFELKRAKSAEDMAANVVIDVSLRPLNFPLDGVARVD